jgi:hypothetical protein
MHLGSGDTRSCYVGRVSGAELANLFSKHRSSIFSLNIRNYIGDTATNKAIKKTAIGVPEEFFFFNNGISALAESIAPDTKDPRILRCKNLSIVNGAQTVRSLHKTQTDNPVAAKKTQVLVRITETQSKKTTHEREFLDSVTKFNNTQNAIKLSDFRSNDKIQARHQDEVQRPPKPEREEVLLQEQALRRDLQRRLGVGPGARLDFLSGDRLISRTVTAIADGKSSRPIQLDCDGLSPGAVTHQAIVRTRPGRLPEVERAIRGAFPVLPVVTGSDESTIIEGIVHDGQMLAQIVAWYMVAAGLCILIVLVVASRAERSREAAVLSALGATPRMLRNIYALEFASIGMLSGCIGNLLACGFGSILFRLIFHHWELAFEWRTAAAALVGSVVLTATAGWLPFFRLLRRQPMSALRRVE